MTNRFSNNESFTHIAELIESYHKTKSSDEKAKIKNTIASEMMPVVKHIARTIARRATDPIEDMIQAGCIGLLKAIDNYSKEKNDNFRVYAGYFIIGEMKHFLRDKLCAIRVPRHIQELTLRINNFTKNLSENEIKNLTNEDVANALEVSTKVVDFALEVDRRKNTVSLEEIFLSDNDNLNYEELLASDDYKESTEFTDAKIIFEEVIEKLPSDEKTILEMFYKQDMSKKDIAEAMSITPTTVSRKIKQALKFIEELMKERKNNA